MVRAELVERFTAGAQAAGAEVLRTPDLAGALAAAAAVLKEARIRAAVVSDTVRAACRKTGLDVPWPEGPADIATAEAGIVAADYGAAATGTLVRLDSGDEEKLVWTLPPLCLCFLATSAIVADLECLSGALAKHLLRPGLPGPQVSFVTGPSRTADIECELTIGVQGPGRLVIVLTETREITEL